MYGHQILKKLLQELCKENHGIEKTIAIIGSGLTAVDAAFTLSTINFQGNLHFISKKGHFPAVHSEKLLPPWYPFKKIKVFPKRLLEMMDLFKSQLKEVSTKGFDWRQLIDSYRTSTQMIWQSFNQQEKRQFMRHLFTLWNRHRHRMSPESLKMLESLKKRQKVFFHSGAIVDLTSLPNHRLKIIYYSTTTGLQELEADGVMNCSGPDYAIDLHPDPLIQNLLKKKMIVSDPLGLGLKVEEKEIVAGKGERKIYAIGSLCFGEKFETTAVPDLREQANSIAQTILKSHL